MDPLVVVGGGAPEPTADLVDELDGHLLVWDERDVERRWAQRPDTTEVRALPGPAWLAAHVNARAAERATTATIRNLLRRHRRADIVLVGRVALLASPWFAGHRGRRIWLPTTDDHEAIVAGIELPPAADGGPHLAVVVDDLAAHRAELEAHTDDRWRWEPGWVAHADRASLTGSATAGRPPELVVHGPPTREHGIDLVGRALASARTDLVERAARLRWVAPTGSDVPAEELDDLRRAHVDHLIDVVRTDHPEDHPALPAAAASILPARFPERLTVDLGPGRAYRGGARLVATDRYARPVDGLERRWDSVPFGDARAMGQAFVRALDGGTAGLAPGPVGIDALLDLVVHP